MDGARQVTFTQDAIREHCKAFISGLIDVSAGKIDADADFDRLGLDSAMAVGMIFDLEEWMGIELSPSLLFDHSNINQLSQHLAEAYAATASTATVAAAE